MMGQGWDILYEIIVILHNGAETFLFVTLKNNSMLYLKS